ncbi:pyridoxal 5'-phosphate synthase glutaminase subunit PdxT [Prevotella sp. PINT]|jgi:pyridoxal 5''-phosphate synthase, glutaminase subunit Pdx2|uniref:pyridoxal 5'-phosphate synthase glutaminase subunit PdxT n=1 Tax=Palleniella intestinalis TaxID=2736291 RepID=UPI001554C79D|nr:pyridoxal 5'-phosphate synthase glutaminase subunit PdxT [Palleniella intestinalis]NPD83076.1 pyridoxal 5'-phosphate synthase glutaminase subunit PdxT [Palleniella intestinalis]
MKIAILALQGAFAEHSEMLQRIGVESFLVRNIDDWQQPKDGLIIPGGESTAMMRIIRDEGLFTPIRDAILNGLPVFGTCAGLIMLDHEHLGTMDITVKRNAYGRQLGSFRTVHTMKGIGEIPMTFIRAPYITAAGDNVEVLAELNGHIVAAQQGSQLVTAFHPELNNDTCVHEFFVKNIVNGGD